MRREATRTVLIGLGKMGMSHLAILNAHPDVDLVAVCDSSDYVLDILSKYTGVKTYSNYRKMLEQGETGCGPGGDTIEVSRRNGPGGA